MLSETPFREVGKGTSSAVLRALAPLTYDNQAPFNLAQFLAGLLHIF